jgi:hypothetical protein
LRSDDAGRVAIPCAEPGVAYDVWILGGGDNVKLENLVLDPAQPLVGGKR